MTVSGHAWLRVTLFGAGVMLALPGFAAQAPVTSAGPGRITCRSVHRCALSIGTASAMTYHIDAAALPKADRQRLVRQCTPSGKPCVATVEGTEMGDPLTVKARTITFYN